MLLLTVIIIIILCEATINVSCTKTHNSGRGGYCDYLDFTNATTEAQGSDLPKVTQKISELGLIESSPAFEVPPLASQS